MPSRTLILAYGNPLRSDDGVAWRAAELLEKKLDSADVEIMCTHQLMPELAERIAYAKGVIFIDAAQGEQAGRVQYTSVIAASDSTNFTHLLSPAQLFTLSQTLYGTIPQGFSVSIAANSFEHGETLSNAIQMALPELVDAIVKLVSQLRHDMQ